MISALMDLLSPNAKRLVFDAAIDQGCNRKQRQGSYYLCANPMQLITLCFRNYI